MLDLNKDFLPAVGRVIDLHGTTFDPGLIVEDISRNTGRPEEEILGDTLEWCRELVVMGTLWCTKNYLHMKENTCLVVRTGRILRQAIAQAEAKNSATSPA